MDKTAVISVRLAELRDVDDLLRIKEDSIRNNSTSLYDQKQIDSWANSIRREDCIKDIDDGRLHVAVDTTNEAVDTTNEAVVGFGSVKKSCRSGSIPGQVVYEVRWLFVASSYAGKGVGSRLYADLENAARKVGADLMVVKSSLSAKNFYVKCGFQEEELGGKASFCDGCESVLCTPMRKVIST